MIQAMLLLIIRAATSGHLAEAAPPATPARRSPLTRMRGSGAIERPTGHADAVSANRLYGFERFNRQRLKEIWLQGC
jgi:hypothetical protein